MFAKPRALAYFTGRKTCVNAELTPKKVLLNEIEKYKPDYFLINFEVTDDSTKTYFAHYQPPTKIVFSNKKFVLFKLEKSTQD